MRQALFNGELRSQWNVMRASTERETYYRDSQTQSPPQKFDPTLFSSDEILRYRLCWYFVVNHQQKRIEATWIVFKPVAFISPQIGRPLTSLRLLLAPELFGCLISGRNALSSKLLVFRKVQVRRIVLWTYFLDKAGVLSVAVKRTCEWSRLFVSGEVDYTSCIFFEIKGSELFSLSNEEVSEHKPE